MGETRVVHCKMAQYDVYIGRPGDWGNPFPVEEYGRIDSIEKYREWIKTQPELLRRLSELRGKTLGCWCRPFFPCHGDVLKELADAAPAVIERASKKQKDKSEEA